MPNPYPDADEVFPTKDQAYHGGGDTDGAQLPPVPDPTDLPLVQPPDDKRSVG